jgi:hypothetical protein
MGILEENKDSKGYPHYKQIGSSGRYQGENPKYNIQCSTWNINSGVKRYCST